MIISISPLPFVDRAVRIGLKIKVCLFRYGRLGQRRVIGVGPCAIHNEWGQAVYNSDIGSNARAGPLVDLLPMHRGEAENQILTLLFYYL